MDALLTAFRQRPCLQAGILLIWSTPHPTRLYLWTLLCLLMNSCHLNDFLLRVRRRLSPGDGEQIEP